MAQTRVQLKHLLEDIRDGYPFPIEEAILTELIANALDSGCTAIEITTKRRQRVFMLADNGQGMTPKQFEQYHDIAATTKVRGKGIGFAGVGAKLSLLVCKEVISETKRRSKTIASQWWLENEYDAPWKEIPTPGHVTYDSGTAVCLNVRDKAVEKLLSEEAVAQMIQKHFYPLLNPKFVNVLSYIYPMGVKISVNGEHVEPLEAEGEKRKEFVVRVGRRRKPVGIGVLVKVSEDLEDEQWGLAVSTYGKVIKRGWDWLKLTPAHPARITGIVEVPDLVECLITNKADFMQDAKSLQKFYKYRKAIQAVVSEVLDDLGETRRREATKDRTLERLQKELRDIVGEILPDFPELEPLFGRRQRGEEVEGILPDPEAPVAAVEVEGSEVMTGDQGGRGEGEGVEALPGPLPGPHLEISDDPTDPAKPSTGRRKRPGLMVGFDDETGGDRMAWLRGDTIWINSLHPACSRAQSNSSENLYVMLAIATELSSNLEADKSPLDFITRFMGVWGSNQ